MYLVLDDILVTGPIEVAKGNIRIHTLVLQRLAQAGFRMKASKCSFLSEEVEYLVRPPDRRRRNSLFRYDSMAMIY